MIKYASLGILLFITWLLLSGHYNPLLISLGMASVLFVVYLAARLDVVDQESLPIHVGPHRFLAYWAWLSKEIIVANLQVTRAILNPKDTIKPQVIKVDTAQNSEVAEVTYANSITLTPGTVTMDLTDDHITVHALLEESAEGLQSGEMARKIQELMPKP